MVPNISRDEIHKSIFQYSLCRVVLMVVLLSTAGMGSGDFQYSLCRVVLMVAAFLD